MVNQPLGREPGHTSLQEGGVTDVQGLVRHLAQQVANGAQTPALYEPDGGLHKVILDVESMAHVTASSAPTPGLPRRRYNSVRARPKLCAWLPKAIRTKLLLPCLTSAPGPSVHTSGVSLPSSALAHGRYGRPVARGGVDERTQGTCVSGAFCQRLARTTSGAWPTFHGVGLPPY